MNAADRLDALDRAGEALAQLGEGEVSLNYSPTAHPGVRYGVLLHGPYGATYVGTGSKPSAAFARAAEKLSDALARVA